jgi:hypothetical protein
MPVGVSRLSRRPEAAGLRDRFYRRALILVPPWPDSSYIIQKTKESVDDIRLSRIEGRRAGRGAGGGGWRGDRASHEPGVLVDRHHDAGRGQRIAGHRARVNREEGRVDLACGRRQAAGSADRAGPAIDRAQHAGAFGLADSGFRSAGARPRPVPRRGRRVGQRGQRVAAGRLRAACPQGTGPGGDLEPGPGREEERVDRRLVATARR